MENKKDFSFYLNNINNNINNKDLLQNLIEKLGYKYPSSIQEKILLSKFLNDKDNLISCSVIKSEAGTGKTLAYLIPLIQCLDISIKNQVQVIILTPTRELALQTEEYINKIENVKYKILIGGKANIPGKVKKDKLDKNDIPTIIVGTLGKLRDIIISKKAKTFSKNFLKFLKCIIIDEADKMIEQNKPPQNLLESFLNYLFGFIFKKNELDKNIKNIIFCSASFNKTTELFYSNILSKYNNNNIFNYFCSNNEETKIINENIKEYYINFYDKKHESYYEQKYKALIILLSSLQTKYNQCLIFYNKKGKGQELSQDLRNNGFSICFIHGELNQDERQLIYNKIKALEYKIILSTDLLSRGIDLTAVNLVINFDSAFNSIEHNHRNGRTGRFFEKGMVISLIENKTPINENNNKDKSNYVIDADNLEKNLDKIKNEFVESERLKKEDVDKINLGQNKDEEILKDALTVVNGVNSLLQKKRKLQYENESIIKDNKDNKDKKEESIKDNEDNENIEEENSDRNIQINEKKKKFCLYCDFFKIFDD